MSSDPRSDPPAQPHGATQRAPPDTLVPQATSPPHTRIAAGDPVALAAGVRPLPEYELKALLGRGGCGEVWKAVGPGGFEIALKCVRLGDQAGRIELRSLELMKGIRHAHLLPMFGAWQREDLLIIAMELADRTLWHRWQEAANSGQPGIPREELLVYLHEAAKGLDFLNERRHPSGTGELVGIQHKDIKPQNLLLVGGTVKVADFGLAKFLEHTVTHASGGLTPAYAAPEFFQGQATRWSDQYCLGVSYCLLRGGRLPFEGTAMQVMAGHALQHPDLSMLPAEERPAVLRALAKVPEERWPSCRDFAEAVAAGGSVSRGTGERTARMAPSAPQPAALTNPATHEAPTALSPALEQRAPGGRRSRVAGLVAVILLAALGALAVAWWQLEPRPARKKSAPGEQLALAANDNDKEPVSPEPAPPSPPPQPPDAGEKPAFEEPARPNPPQPPDDFPAPVAMLRMLPIEAVALDTGQSGVVEVRVQRRECAGPVRFEVEGLPRGVRAGPAVTLPADKDVAKIELRAFDRAEGGAHTFRIRAELGKLRTEQQVLLTVRITPGLLLPAIDAVTVQSRQSRTVTVHVQRRNTTGPVDLHLEDLPDGIRARTVQIPVGSNSARLELNVSGRAAPGKHDVRVVAVAAGVRGERKFQLTVGPVRPAAEWIADFTKAIEQHPDDAANYFDRGRMYAEQKDYDKAIADFTQVTRLDPRFASAYHNRANCYVRTKEYDKVIADADRVLEIDPYYAAAYNTRGIAHNDRKEFDKALADYNEAIRLYPQYAVAYTNRGNWYLRIKDYDKALADYQEAIKHDPTNALAHNGLGNVHHAKKQPELALADYNEVIRLDPHMPVGFNNRGNIYRERQEYDKALADYAEAIRLDPSYALAYSNRARVYEKKGDLARAKLDRQKAASLNAAGGK